MKVYVVIRENDGGCIPCTVRVDWNVAVKFVEENFPEVDMDELRSSKLIQDGNPNWWAKLAEFESVRITQLDLS